MYPTPLFRDLAGLDANQANALQALLTTTQSAQDFSERAARMAEMAANLEALKMMDEDGTLSDADREKLKKQGYNNATQKPYNNKKIADIKKMKDDGLTNKGNELADKEIERTMMTPDERLITPDTVANADNFTYTGTNPDGSLTSFSVNNPPEAAGFGGVPEENILNDIESSKIAFILLHKNESIPTYGNYDFDDHISSLKQSNYYIEKVYSGSELLWKIMQYQNKQGVPETDKLLILSHGFYGGVMGFESWSGLYSTQYYKHRKDFYSTTINDWNSDFATLGYAWFLQNIAPDGKKFRFSSNAQILIGGCNSFVPSEIQIALTVDENLEDPGRVNQINRNEIETFASIKDSTDLITATRWASISFASEFSAALGGVDVICAAPVLVTNSNNQSYIKTGQTSTYSNKARKSTSWYKVGATCDVLVGGLPYDPNNLSYDWSLFYKLGITLENILINTEINLNTLIMEII